MTNLKILNKLKEDLKQGKTLILFTSLQTAGSVIRMISPLVIAGIFSEQMWGRYSLCEPIVLFFSALLILSARNPFIVYANEERGQTGSIRKTFSVQCIFLGSSIFIFLGVILIFGKFITSLAKIEQTDLIYVSLAFFALIIKDFAGNLFMAMNQRIRNAILEISFGTLTLAFIVIFYLSNFIGLKWIFLSYFFAALVVLTGTIFAINFKMLLPLFFDKKHLGKMLAFTFWGMAGAVSSYIINWAGVWLLKYYTGDIEQSGSYNLGFKFFKGFTILTYIASGYFLPHLSEHANNTEKIKAYLYHKRPRILVLGAGCLALAWVIAPYFLNLLYPGKYPGAGLVIRILIIGSFAFLYTAMYFPLFTALKKYKFIQIIIVTQVILNIILSILLIPRYTLSGAAIATAISYFYLAFGFEYYYRIKLKKLI
ncbi:MAG: polysaccharide biosynthesis C-terminal domain-containing protein [Sedimentisphaerales bacterium]|nr:polysaccharide biosynthesis C-terminal domain-containing protein [Sedimentisphaerales bacterium]